MAWQVEKVGRWWHVVRFTPTKNGVWRDMDGDTRHETERAAMARADELNRQDANELNRQDEEIAA